VIPVGGGARGRALPPVRHLAGGDDPLVNQSGLAEPSYTREGASAFIAYKNRLGWR
jgi:hypothetical protein